MSNRQGKDRFGHLRFDDGEGWIFAYADMMSLLLGFFIILYSFSQMSDQQLKSLTQEISEAFKGEKGEKKKSDSEVGITTEQRQLRALEMLVAMTEIAPDVHSAVEKIEDMNTAVKTSDQSKKPIEELAITSEKLMVVAGRDREALLEMVLPASLLFRTTSTTLTSKAKVELRTVAKSILNIEHLVRVEITGHTDTRPEERSRLHKDPWALSASRAGSVAASLISYGVNPLTLKVQGMAFYDPLFEEYTPFGEPILENMQRNRRVHIKVFRKDQNFEVEKSKKKDIEGLFRPHTKSEVNQHEKASH